MWLVFEKGAETYCVGIKKTHSSLHGKYVVAKVAELHDLDGAEFDGWGWEEHRVGEGRFSVTFQTSDGTLFCHMYQHPEYLLYVSWKFSPDMSCVGITTSVADHCYPARFEDSLRLGSFVLK